MSIKLIVGLQNPGASYEKTRHNAGGWYAKLLVEHEHSSFKLEKKLHCEMAELNIAGQKVRIIFPSTYMNHSGLAVRAVAQFYKIHPSEMLVAHDELDINEGRIKLKSGGGHGGHNGLRDIISQLGSQAFHRLRIGIGHPGHKELVHDYVLSKPTNEQRNKIISVIDKAINITPMIVEGKMALAMNQLNS